jgi:hypothetical protein
MRVEGGGECEQTILQHLTVLIIILITLLLSNALVLEPFVNFL